MAIQQAAELVDRMDRYEEPLASFQNFISVQQDTLRRVRGLLNLTQFYHREFGIHFEKRHAFREQLNRILTGDLATVDEARFEARIQYAELHGKGLPKLEALARYELAA